MHRRKQFRPLLFRKNEIEGLRKAFPFGVPRIENDLKGANLREWLLVIKNFRQRNGNVGRIKSLEVAPEFLFRQQNKAVSK